MPNPIYVLSGPDLNLQGRRQPKIFATTPDLLSGLGSATHQPADEAGPDFAG